MPVDKNTKGKEQENKRASSGEERERERGKRDCQEKRRRGTNVLGAGGAGRVEGV